MIEAHELTKRYGGTTAVHSLSFTVATGTVTGFLGPNGAGKSTTMRMIMGLDRPTSGTVVPRTSCGPSADRDPCGGPDRAPDGGETLGRRSGDEGNRTPNPRLAKAVLCQLKI